MSLPLLAPTGVAETTAPTTVPAYVLIVDDEPAVRQSLARGLVEAGYACVMAADGQAALTQMQQHRFAVMLCDIRMPGMSGMEVLGHAIAHDPDLPVVMVTALAGLDTALGAIRAGAYDYVTKPFTFAEVEVVVQRAVAYRQLRLDNRQYVERLEELVEVRTRQAREVAVGVITSLGLALETKSEWTHSHSRRVADLSASLGQQIGLTTEECVDLRLAGMLHDIGKIGVPEALLLKPGALTPAEFAHIKRHPDLGARILSPLRELDRIVPFIRHHHERWDGRGYPDGLTGDAIPFGARIIGGADAYVAMREHRPYRRGMTRERALDEIRNGANQQFDREIVQVLLLLGETGVLEQLDQRVPRDVPEWRLAGENGSTRATA